MARARHKTIVKMASMSAALLLMVAYSSFASRKSKPSYSVSEQRQRDWGPQFGRRLLESNGSSTDNAHCHDPMNQKDSCNFVKDYCSDDVALANYLAMVACGMPGVKVLGYILMALWLLYLISLLATTADYFFVPPLTLLSNKLRLSPSIAGITLLAIGNGAPDVFTAYSALKNNDIALLLGALIGASIFISTVVLGSVILISNFTSKTIDKIDLMRDIITYMLVVGMVVGVAFDGTVHLYEAILFPLAYFAYVAVVIVISFVRRWCAKRSALRLPDPLLDESKIGHPPALFGDKKESACSDIEHSSINVSERTALLHDAAISLGCRKNCKHVVELPGLTWPRGRNFFVKIQWILEYPFSILRWLTIPPCCHDGKWSSWHRYFAIIYPMPAMMLILVAVKGWEGFYWDFPHSSFPVVALLLAVGMVLSVVLFFLVPNKQPPHWSVQFILGLSAFILSIAWLNIEANEIVSLLESFGIAFKIDTAILGLTVLAVGNSVGDWVADTAVARAGQPGMGVASCFGSPLLNDVLGFSIALMVKIGIYDKGKVYTIDINDPHFAKVKLSWVFLGISLLMSAIVLPVFRFSPPKAYGIVLLYIYAVFMIFSVLDEVNVLPIRL